MCSDAGVHRAWLAGLDFERFAAGVQRIRKDVDISRADFDKISDKGKRLGREGRFNRVQFRDMIKDEVWPIWHLLCRLRDEVSARVSNVGAQICSLTSLHSLLLPLVFAPTIHYSCGGSEGEPSTMCLPRAAMPRHGQSA